MLLALAVMVVGAWLASGWWYAQVRAGFGEVKVSNGRVSLLVWNDQGGRLMKEFGYKGDGVFAIAPGDRGWLAWADWGNAGRFASRPLADVRYVRIPLWMLLVPIGGAALWRWALLRRPARAGRCLACGYDLKGLAAGSGCPECGEAADTEQRTTSQRT